MKIDEERGCYMYFVTAPSLHQLVLIHNTLILFQLFVEWSFILISGLHMTKYVR